MTDTPTSTIPVTDDQNTVTQAAPSDPQVQTPHNISEPANPVGRRQKEVAPMPIMQPPAVSMGSSELSTDSVEQASSSPAEVEPAKELEPEVEKMVEKIRDQKVKGPNETVISAKETPESVPKTVAQPVVVLPLTEKGMKKGKSKSPENSVRWLYEWCVRQIRKMRDFLLVYREE